MALDESKFIDSNNWHIPLYAKEQRQLTVNPVGNWRFLTPFDVLQKGDLARYTSKTERYVCKADADWTPIPPKGKQWNFLLGNCYFAIAEGTPMCELIPYLEAIRPLDDEALYVWRG